MKEQRKILDMLSEGKITPDQAEKLLAAIGKSQEPEVESQSVDISSGVPRFLCVIVEPKSSEKGERVNIRVPLKIIKAGMKLQAFLPDSVKEKTQKALNDKGVNFDLNHLKPENIDEFLLAMKDLSINVDSNNETVRVCCE